MQLRTTAAPQRTLADRFDSRDNSLNALRLLFAAMVAIGHCSLLAFGQKPLHLGSVEIQEVGVDGFFAISGFLITMSWIRSPNPVSYLIRRAGRIFPGYWVALVVTAFVAGPIIWRSSHGSFAGFPVVHPAGAAQFVIYNLALWVGQGHIAGVAAHSTLPLSSNGSLWSLFPEFVAYIGVLCLGLAGGLRKRGWVAPALVGLFAALTLFNVVDHASFARLSHSPILAGNVVRVFCMFAAGMTLCLWQERVRLDGRLCLIAVGVVLVSGLAPDFEMISALCLAYVIMWAGSSSRFSRIGRAHDLSYGLYLYAWPVMQVLTTTPVRHAGYLGFTVMCLIIASALAYGSWNLVERPTMDVARRIAHDRQAARRARLAVPRGRQAVTSDQ